MVPYAERAVAATQDAEKAVKALARPDSGPVALAVTQHGAALEASSVLAGDAATATASGQVVYRLVGAERIYAIAGRGQPPPELTWAMVQAEMLRLHVRRRLSERLDGVAHGPAGSLDKLLMTWTEQAAGHAALAVGGSQDPELLSAYLYSRAQSVMGGTSQIQKNIIAARILGLPAGGA